MMYNVSCVDHPRLLALPEYAPKRRSMRLRFPLLAHPDVGQPT